MFLLNDTTHRMIVRYHPTIGHLWVPNQSARIPHERGGYIVRTNSQSFRSDVEFHNQHGARPRILFFGDSMTAGDGCYNHERFSDQLGEILDAEVYNYGLSGSGTDQHLLIFEQFAHDVEADLIVLGIFVENIERIKAAYRPTIDRLTRRRLLVPKPYFTLDAQGRLQLNHNPVPLHRPEEGTRVDGVQSSDAARRANPRLTWAYGVADALRADPRLERVGRMLSPQEIDDHTRLRSALLRVTDFQPYSDYRNWESAGCRLMRAIVERFLEKASPCPVLLMLIPNRYYFLDMIEPIYQKFYQTFSAPERNVHVFDLTEPLCALPRAERKRLTFRHDFHFSAIGHLKVAELLAHKIRLVNLLPNDAPAPNRGRTVSTPRHTDASIYVLGISCFYHDSAASLVKDGDIVAAAEEERFTRIKNDRGFPVRAVNFCLEQAGIDVSELKAVVYYDNSQLTFERLMHTAVEIDNEGRDYWQRMIPSWIQYKLRLPELIRRYLKYEGLVLQNSHHRSHAASAFFASPYREAAVLTVDGVGEWATASIGIGRKNRLDLLKEMRFPNSLGLLYSAFTQFTGFRVNDGEYKMMGLAPYGLPTYVDLILDRLVDLKGDGSVELNMEYFAFLSRPTMTNERFAELFGGPARKPGDRITQREMDIARSVQCVLEEAMLRMAGEAKRLTGQSKLCMAGGVALNCVANGRILREGPFDDLWIQPAAGDAGASLGAALDVYHSYFGKPRVYRADGRSLQQGSYLGPEFSDAEIEAFLQTYGYPYRKRTPEERSQLVAQAVATGKIVGHFAGRAEFGPRALGARSILGDPRNEEMQVTLNLKTKYRESFRPFAPTVLAERISDYFDLNRESPYMLLIVPVKAERRLAFNRGNCEALLDLVRIPRSDIPAVTHVDYSARVQSITREDHPVYYDALKAFEKQTGCAVFVNTSFNVNNEPIVNTPEEAYHCFMHTEMDVLVLGNCYLLKADQPSPIKSYDCKIRNDWNSTKVDPKFLLALTRTYDKTFLPTARRLKSNGYIPLIRPFKQSPSTWENCAIPATLQQWFEFPFATDDGAATAQWVEAVTAAWSNAALAASLKPTIKKVVETGRKFTPHWELFEDVPDSIYVMF
jgi:carbamoyltransferase